MEDREKLITEKIKAEEHAEMIQLDGIKQKVWDILTKEKDFHPEEIEIDPTFQLVLSDREITASIEFVINLPAASFMVIKCTPTSIESWERYVIAFARVIKDYQIPYAMVTDGDRARIMDVLKGSLVGESIEGLFHRQEALNRMKDFQKIPCPEERLERGKRIVYAFEGIKCPTVKDTQD
ncbi:MAG: hypothetical protein FJ241_00160 [Nitrospira sp.]|nr:hypothetical protein [Nitrospira sp.]